jgi:hypothetical protein
MGSKEAWFDSGTRRHLVGAMAAGKERTWVSVVRGGEYAASFVFWTRPVTVLDQRVQNSPDSERRLNDIRNILIDYISNAHQGRTGLFLGDPLNLHNVTVNDEFFPVDVDFNFILLSE